MKIFIPLLLAFALLSSCNNNNAAAKTFCDTLCKSDSFKYKGNARYNQSLSIALKNCMPDTLTWTHGKLIISRKIDLLDFLGKNIKMNGSATECFFQDTVCAWLSFNDCISSRGYILKLPFTKEKTIQKITSAMNRFDPKFSISDSLLAYTDKGSIFIIDPASGKEAQMTFKEEYPIDFYNIHKVVDSIAVTRTRIYVKLLKNGIEVPLEKQISL
ncbi:MAG: hypothetical protein NVS1B13_15950 [Flavisolibacter sp.]